MLLSTKTELTERLARKKAALSKLEDLLDSDATEIGQSFEIDTGEASQRVTKKDPDKILRIIDRLEKQIALIQRRLNGTNAIRFVTNRRG